MAMMNQRHPRPSVTGVVAMAVVVVATAFPRKAAVVVTSTLGAGRLELAVAAGAAVVWPYLCLIRSATAWQSRNHASDHGNVYKLTQKLAEDGVLIHVTIFWWFNLLNRG